MAHCITAIIGLPGVVDPLAVRAHCPVPTALLQGFVIAPLGEDQIDAITKLDPGSYRPEFEYLSETLEQALAAASVAGPLAYIETEYFGGAGSQAAAMFDRGTCLYQATLPVGAGVAKADDPINTALRMIGVAVTHGRDAFDTIGLSQFRDMESLGRINDDED